MNIGQLLKEARSKAGFTQEYVAESISVSRQTISNWENEKLVFAIAINIVLIILLMIFSKAIPNNGIYFSGIFSLSVITVTFLLYQIIKRI